MGDGLLPLVTMVGPLVTLVGLALMVWGDRVRRRRTRVSGTIVRWDHAGVGTTAAAGRKLRSVPVVRFTTADGQQVETAARWGADYGVYRTGRPVEVWHDPQDPRDVVIRRTWLDRPYAMVVLAGMVLTVLLVVLPRVLGLVLS